MTLTEKRAAFRSLHEGGVFVMPNPWDAGSAKLFQSLGFKALASTSAGFAWSNGHPDYGVSRDAVLSHLKVLTAATDLPINADYENAFADDPDGVASNVTLAVEAGVSGLSVEDATGRQDAPLYDFDLAVARVAAARAAIDKSGTGVVLTARSEAFLVGVTDLEEVKRRMIAFAQAGADCLFAPGVSDIVAIGELVTAITPKPFNVVIGAPGRTVAELAAVGVRRISTGGSLARAAYGEAYEKARQLLQEGRYQPFAPIAPFKSINEALK